MISDRKIDIETVVLQFSGFLLYVRFQFEKFIQNFPGWEVIESLVFSNLQNDIVR